MSAKCFEVGIRGESFSRFLYAESAGKAKSRYQREYLYDLDVPFTAITCKEIAGEREDEGLAHTANYRGVPFARIGMRVEAGGFAGRIVGKNTSANFDIQFEDGPHKGLILNCHPNWKMKYFSETGELIKEF